MKLISGSNEKNEDYNYFSQLIIVNHLKIFSLKFEKYFPLNQDSRKGFLWNLDPFNFNCSTNTLSTQYKE